jgi:hypothetical protein
MNFWPVELEFFFSLSLHEKQREKQIIVEHLESLELLTLFLLASRLLNGNVVLPTVPPQIDCSPIAFLCRQCCFRGGPMKICRITPGKRSPFGPVMQLHASYFFVFN